jgi:hypothetical protein
MKKDLFSFFSFEYKQLLQQKVDHHHHRYDFFVFENVFQRLDRVDQVE